MSAFRGQVALVTGAGSGIGRAIALELAAGGASLTLVGRRRTLLEAVQPEIEARGAVAAVHPADIANDQDVHRLAAELGRVDLLIHAAGVVRMGTVADSSVSEFDEQYRTNVRGPALLTQLLLPALRQLHGQVVFINSSAGITARAGFGAYAATKHALKALADSLRDEINRDDVRVLSVYCGRTATPMQLEVHAAEQREYRPERLIQPEDIAAMVAASLALPRTAEVTDLHIRPRLAPV